jgi:hypothetical protein
MIINLNYFFFIIILILMTFFYILFSSSDSADLKILQIGPLVTWSYPSLP